MGMKELPKQYSFTCDLCGKEHIQDGGVKFEIIPQGWSQIIINQKNVNVDGYKRTGREELLLCPDHSSKVNHFLFEEKHHE